MAQNLLTALSDNKNFGEGKLLENTSKDKDKLYLTVSGKKLTILPILMV